jgi:tripartite ATP-independent transporter DctM subunit
LKPARVVRAVEEGALVAALAAAMLLPLVDSVARPLGFYVPGGADYLQQLTLWLAFLGGLVAAREGRHLTLSTAELMPARVQRLGHVFAAAVSTATVALLAYASVGVLGIIKEEGRILPGGVAVWVSECIMPVALAGIALRFAWRASPRWPGRAVSLGTAGLLLAFAFGWMPEAVSGRMGELLANQLVWPLVVLILAALLLGTPVFVAMAALAFLLFFKDDTPITAVSYEVHRLIASPTLPAIPLLTGAGYVLAESQASLRLFRFFKALLGWMPGGLAVIVIAVCAMFTTFTGGSGVTIIALGGLVYPMLRKDGYPEGFSLGLITAAGSLGLLFPPSLPVILYSIVAGTREQNVPADQLYLAGLVPGLLMITLVALYSIYVSRRIGGTRQAFSGRELAAAAWAAKWELAMPVLVIYLFASGRATMIETAASALLYSIVVECFLTRDLHLFRTLPAALVKSSVLTGAVLILLSAAMGVTNFIVQAEVPRVLVEWVRAHIESQVVFLLALNLLLVVVGCLVDIYSAIIVLAPLIVPMGAAFDVDPVHQGVIFLANLELGFLTPPVGLNLYLSSSRFAKPLTDVIRHSFPFLVIMTVAVLLITYVPGMSIGLARLLGK